MRAVIDGLAGKDGSKLTEEQRDALNFRPHVFRDLGEVEQALAGGQVNLHTAILASVTGFTEDGKTKRETTITTPGRLMMGALLPHAPERAVTPHQPSADQAQHLGRDGRRVPPLRPEGVVIFADRLMGLGFRNAAKAGISFGKDDMMIPATKAEMIDRTKNEVKEFEQQYLDGLITAGERYNKVVDAWSRATEEVAGAMMKEISRQEAGKQTNSVWMMSHSGARGSPAQMRQLAGMRGLMAKPSGEIIEQPIISNFKEGLTVLEYFNSTHGARKGLADTALKTANSGYLTRRLVDVAQDCIIVDPDCGTERGITVRAVMDGGEVVSSLSERILGRTVQRDILDPETGAVIAPRNTLLDEVMADAAEKAGVEEVYIRSVLTCDARQGVCGMCYGRDLARGTPVNVGEAVGVIAAQSIGEPGTQLTMRTFHIGGAAQRSAEQSHVEATSDGSVKVLNKAVVVNSEGANIVMARNCEIVLSDAQGRERARYRVPYGARLLVEDGAEVTRAQKLADWDPFTLPIIIDRAGVVEYTDLIEGVTLYEETDPVTGLTSKVVRESGLKNASLRPSIVLREGGKVVVTFGLQPASILNVENGATVHAGDVIARLPRESSKTRDITGGLPRVAELFEARRPKDAAIISDVDGRVEFGKDYKAKRRIVVVPDAVGDEQPASREYLVPKGKHVSVQEGDYVRAGDPLVDGPRVPHDILRVLGVEALANYLVNEIQDVYRLQGVKINDKHIEVIVRQMLQKVEIIEPGDTTYLIGEQVDRIEFDIENEKRLEVKERPARAEPVLQGITKASLQTNSFISAASFQETTRVLTEAAVAGKVDRLEGLKENVIVGRLIPAGTGSVMNRLRALAAQRDKGRLPSNQPALPGNSNGQQAAE